MSTSNFGATPPYTLTWQVSQNGQVISTQTADSFVLPAVSGTYTLSLTVTDAHGNTGTASTSVTASQPLVLQPIAGQITLRATVP